MVGFVPREGLVLEIREKRIDGECIYDGKIIKVTVDTVELPNKNTAKREVVGHPGGVTVLPLTDDDRIVMVRQFRYPYMEELLEIPAGKLEYGEDPYEAGIRELREETGAVAQKYIDLGIMYPTPGYCAEKIYMYAATDLSFFEQDLDEDEFLNVVKIPFEEALSKVVSGEIRDGKTQIAILKYNEMRRSGQV